MQRKASAGSKASDPIMILSNLCPDMQPIVCSRTCIQRVVPLPAPSPTTSPIKASFSCGPNQPTSVPLGCSSGCPLSSLFSSGETLGDGGGSDRSSFDWVPVGLLGQERTRYISQTYSTSLVDTRIFDMGSVNR